MQWQYDVAQYSDVERTICAGGCKDSRITAMWIDMVSNVPMTPSTDVYPWTTIYRVDSPYQIGDIRDRYERDRAVPAQVYAPPIREQWGTDYPADAHRDRPQGLSMLAAAIVAARRAAGIANGTLPVQYGEQGSAP